VLLVTHEMDLAGEIADRVLLLSGGRTLAEGPPAEVLTQDNLRRAFSVESRVEVDAAGRRRIVPVAPTP
jgi:iron complex transport system ATP-binding protein